MFFWYTEWDISNFYYCFMSTSHRELTVSESLLSNLPIYSILSLSWIFMQTLLINIEKAIYLQISKFLAQGNTQSDLETSHS